ncbi:MAG TPA: TSUP family transporter [Gaiellaceae bacterium]|nr:TSUP family transporter [Gaiellaceae bacterium]
MTGTTLYLALVSFGVVAGVASGLLGVGGGTLVVPFLTLAVGFSQHAAEATSLLVILPTAIAGSLVLRRHGVGDLGLALRFGAVGAVGSVLGALLALALPGSTLRIVFAVFVGLVGLRLARDGLFPERQRR